MITIEYNHDYSNFRISITIMITGHNFYSITIIIMITGFPKYDYDYKYDHNVID